LGTPFGVRRGQPQQPGLKRRKTVFEQKQKQPEKQNMFFKQKHKQPEKQNMYDDVVDSFVS